MSDSIQSSQSSQSPESPESSATNTEPLPLCGECGFKPKDHRKSLAADGGLPIEHCPTSTYSAKRRPVPTALIFGRGGEA